MRCFLLFRRLVLYRVGEIGVVGVVFKLRSSAVCMTAVALGFFERLCRGG